MVLQFAAVLLAFVWLAQSMPRHSKQIWGRALSGANEQLHRKAGFVLLILVFIFQWQLLGIAYALLIWSGLSTLASLIVALVLSYRPRWLRWYGIRRF